MSEIKNGLQPSQTPPYDSDIYKQTFGKSMANMGEGGGGYEPTEAQLAAMNSGINSSKVAQIETNKNDIEDLKENLSNYIGNFATKALLDVYSGTLTNNDYAIVEADETHNNECWRYIYNATQQEWLAQYKVNNTPLTQSQLAAINSGIDTTKVSQIETNKNDISSLKDTTKLNSYVGNDAFVYRTTASAGFLILEDYSNTARQLNIVGKMGYLSFVCKGNTSVNGAEWTFLGIIPTGKRPKRKTTILAQVYNGNNNEACGGYVDTEGNVVVWTNAKNASNNYQVRIMATYEIA